MRGSLDSICRRLGQEIASWSPRAPVVLHGTMPFCLYDPLNVHQPQDQGFIHYFIVPNACNFSQYLFYICIYIGNVIKK